ncbi:hypothetical protein CDAR_381601 [Caerostris darwini]|uniref:Uncharacterized protein n=1 Tax=Caerostris darwini TaxID=1538125 RepID=A0AAV4V5K0_9ARAC|nr:hypothetical protein CDAR_381601 [Caerostris darwini]
MANFLLHIPTNLCRRLIDSPFRSSLPTFSANKSAFMTHYAKATFLPSAEDPFPFHTILTALSHSNPPFDSSPFSLCHPHFKSNLSLSLSLCREKISPGWSNSSIDI